MYFKNHSINKCRFSEYLISKNQFWIQNINFDRLFSEIWHLFFIFYYQYLNYTYIYLLYFIINLVLNYSFRTILKCAKSAIFYLFFILYSYIYIIYI